MDISFHLEVNKKVLAVHLDFAKALKTDFSMVLWCNFLLIRCFWILGQNVPVLCWFLTKDPCEWITIHFSWFWSLVEMLTICPWVLAPRVKTQEPRRGLLYPLITSKSTCPSCPSAFDRACTYTTSQNEWKLSAERWTFKDIQNRISISSDVNSWLLQLPLSVILFSASVIWKYNEALMPVSLSTPKSCYWISFLLKIFAPLTLPF